MLRVVFLSAALACAGCYTLKGPQPKLQPLNAQNNLNIDSSRRPPDGTNYKYFQAQGRGANGQLKESTIRSMFQSKKP